MVDLTVSIVSWNVKKLLEECLESIFKHTKGITYEVFVSDNDSTDGTIEMVRARFPEVKLIDNGVNLGFPKANNKVIKVSKGRYVILLNPDTVVTPGSFATLVKFMDDHPEAGAVGPLLEYPDGSFQPSCRAFPTLETEFYRMLFFDQLFPKSRIFGKYMMSYWYPHNDVREVDQPMGAALLVRKEVIDRVGMMDENIFFLFDEVDWCKRIKDAGWTIFFTPEAKIIHHKNKSFSQLKSLKASWGAMKIWRGSRNYYFRKHHGILSVILINLMDILQLALIGVALFLLMKGIILVKDLVF